MLNLWAVLALIIVALTAPPLMARDKHATDARPATGETSATYEDSAADAWTPAETDVADN